MPSIGWDSITVKEEVKRAFREERDKVGMSDSDFLKKLLSEGPGTSKREWVMCAICGERVKAKNLDAHLQKRHPKEAIAGN
jgi:hypothetical protein